MKVSIVIPSRNRYPLNLMTLHALENQTFDPSDMEVILIDDASSDDTPLLRDFHPGYPFRYIRNDTKAGLSRSRNTGIFLARGDILLMLDAEMIVGPGYVLRHYRHHLNCERAVVAGLNKYRCYPFLYPGFSPRQINDVLRIARRHPWVRRRLQQKLKARVSGANLRRYLKRRKRPIPLLQTGETANHARIKQLSVPDRYSRRVRNLLRGRCGRSRLTWMACFGSNLSIPRQLAEEVGGYDETFHGWGVEDREFGYRLYRAGAAFIVDPVLSRYHGEHPRKPGRIRDQSRNLIRFQEKHPELEVCLRSLDFLHLGNLRFMDRVLEEHQALDRAHPGRFDAFEQAIIDMLRCIPVLTAARRPVKRLLACAGLARDPKRKRMVYAQRHLVERLGKYRNLVGLFDRLART